MEQGGLTSSDITNIVKINFDCRPGAIAQSLALREPMYQETAAYGHFGREPYTKNGIKFFEWESAKDLRKYTGMSSADVTAGADGQQLPHEVGRLSSIGRVKVVVVATRSAATSNSTRFCFLARAWRYALGPRIPSRARKGAEASGGSLRVHPRPLFAPGRLRT